MFPGDLLLLTDYNNKSVKLADPTSGQLLDQLQLPGRPHGMCLLPGDRAAVTIPAKSIIQTILVTNKKLALQDGIQIEGQCSAPHTDFTKVKLNRQSDINVKSPTDKRDCYITDLAMLPSDLLLLTDSMNQSVKLADPASGQLLDQLQLPGRPHGMCLLPGDRAAVTIPDKSTIQTIAVTNKKLALQDKIQLQERCFGIDFINDYFVVGFMEPAQVSLVGKNGKIYKSISQNSQLFRYPDYICVTTENTSNVIYVSDRGTNTITRLSEDLQVLQSFRDTALQSLRGLASVGEGQLLVVNCGGLFSPTTLNVLDVTTGQFTQLLGREEKLRFILVGCVAVSHTLRTVYINDYLYIGNMITQYKIKSH